MTDLEIAEQELKELKENVEDIVDDADTILHRIFQDGYENAEKNFDEALAKLSEIKNLL